MSLIMELEEKSAMKTQKVSENERFIYFTSEFALILESFMDLKRFLTKSLQNFINFFEDKNKLNSANVNELLEQNKVIFPIVFLRCL